MIKNNVKAMSLLEMLAAIAIMATLMVLLSSVYMKTGDRWKKSVCVSNLRSIGAAVQMYVAEYGNYPPGGSPWGTDPDDKVTKHMGPMVMGVSPPLAPVYTGTCLSPYFKGRDLRVFQCPADPKTKQGWCSYGYNGAYLGGHVDKGAGTFVVSGMPARVGNIRRPAQTVLIVEGQTDDMQPPSGTMGGYNWTTYSRWLHGGGMNVAFCDGHVEWRKQSDEDLNAKDDRLWSGQ